MTMVMVTVMVVMMMVMMIAIMKTLIMRRCRQSRSITHDQSIALCYPQPFVLIAIAKPTTCHQTLNVNVLKKSDSGACVRCT